MFRIHGANRILLLFATLGMALVANVAAASSKCTGPNGSLFNLEPRPNAIVQTAQSVAFLLGGASKGNDLVVATANDARGLITNSQATLVSEDAFYVQRSNSNCTPDFEGGEVAISNATDLFDPFGNPTVVADPQHSAFYIVDLRFGITTDDNGVGIERTTAATLLNATSCPNGTEQGTAFCWPLGAVNNITQLNANLFNPQIAVDQRSSGTGAGDVYTVVTENDSQNTNPHISLTACTNGLNCGNSINVSSTDTNPDFAWIQVRPDGDITISYRSTKFPGINPEEIKFVNCTPNGAPKAPTCSTPVLVTTEKNPTFASFIGDVSMTNILYPKHVNRLEADGKTVTTFLVYDRCDVPLISGFTETCPKTDVVVTSSNNGGSTWSPIAKVSSAKGQQFFGAIADDVSTGTINIAYYSTENDPQQQQAQVFLAQILPGATTVAGIHQLTTGFADVQASPPLSFTLQPVAFGSRLGVAASGTGAMGQSRAYVTFTWNSVNGIYNGASSPDVNNHIVSFQY
jgi:hypothetical protein